MQILPCNEHNYMVCICYLWGNSYARAQTTQRTYFNPYDLSLKISLDVKRVPDCSTTPGIHLSKKKIKEE